MRYLKGGVLLLAAVGAFSATAANAQSRTAAEAWNSPYSGPSDNQKQLDLEIAIARQQINNGGYGPSTTNIGTYNQTNTYNGAVNSSNSANIVNSNSTTSTVSGSNITLTTTTSQTAGPASQGASSGVVNGNGNTINLGVTK